MLGDFEVNWLVVSTNPVEKYAGQIGSWNPKDPGQY